MSDIPTTARTARESLARGLSALQSDPNIPPQLVDLAAPIAQAMSALHQIERNNGAQLSPFADTALQNVRTALSSLQSQPNQHPAVAQAMEAVAGSLGLVHALSKLAVPAAGAPVAQPAPAAQPAFPPPAAHHAPPPAQQPAYAQPAAQYAPPPAQQPAYAQPAAQYAPPPAQYAPPPAQQPAYAQPVANPYAPAPAQQPFGQPAADPFGSPGRSPMAATALAPPGAPAPGVPVSGRPPAPPAMGDVPTINADLGANSPSNFYKGLSGNDIIDHGGLFVSTYMIPKIGTSVRLRVSLPGGYEFEANGVVRWAREAAGDAAPGFGAQLTQITPEARQLVYRYVRNREPIFHDDL